MKGVSIGQSHIGDSSGNLNVGRCKKARSFNQTLWVLSILAVGWKIGRFHVSTLDGDQERTVPTKSWASVRLTSYYGL